MIRGGNTLNIPVDDAMVVQVPHAGQDETGHDTKGISSHCYQRVKNDQTYGSTALASRPDKWPRWLRRSKEITAYSEVESEVVFCPPLEPPVKFDLQQTKHGQETKRRQHERTMRGRG
jgi:hypothetical protein